MKRKIRKFYQAVIAELTEHKNTFFVYLGLRLLVLGILILQIFHQNYENAFLCILTLILMITPSVIQATLKVEFPSPLEIIVLIFIFSAEILGEIRSFYMRFLYRDTVLHTLNGFLCAAIGFSLVDIMNRQRKMKFDLSPLFMAITAFCFSMTIGVLWEFFEFGMDFLWNLDMQKDTVIHSIHSTLLNTGGQNQSIHITNIQEVVIDGKELGIEGYLDIGLIDTMSDLIVNFIGAIIFSTMGYFYVKHRNSKSLVKGFVPEPWSKEKHSDIED
ncbi:hypothetical protein IMSAGC019_04134 [Lachnospiraceae bacterium]|nr:hypothetical protein IMSAGC019_04134 [Lachnospiraceae bacterium]